jgi:hypothetical protein
MVRWISAIAVLSLACASAPPAPAPGRSHVYGELRLVPREGVKPGGHSSSYGDRRLRDVELVDYSSPGFAVVYLSEEPVPADELRLVIRADRVAPRLEPALAAVGARGAIVIENRTGTDRVLSYPAAGRVTRLAPGEEWRIPVARPGEQGLFLLDGSNAATTLFASPGPYDVVSSTGRFALLDVDPGAHELRAWHPRFPPSAQAIVLEAGRTLKVDIELGVGRSGEAGHAHAP